MLPHRVVRLDTGERFAVKLPDICAAESSRRYISWAGDLFKSFGGERPTQPIAAFPPTSTNGPCSCAQLNPCLRLCSCPRQQTDLQPRRARHLVRGDRPECSRQHPSAVPANANRAARGRGPLFPAPQCHDQQTEALPFTPTHQQGNRRGCGELPQQAPPSCSCHRLCPDDGGGNCRRICAASGRCFPPTPQGGPADPEARFGWQGSHGASVSISGWCSVRTVGRPVHSRQGGAGCPVSASSARLKFQR